MGIILLLVFLLTQVSYSFVAPVREFLIPSFTLDSITSYTFLVGLMYLAVTPFPISIRNSPIAVAHLARKTGVRYMFVSSDPAMQRLAHQANEILVQDGCAFECLPMPLFEDLYGPGGDEALVPMGDVDEMKTSIIMHSSGACL